MAERKAISKKLRFEVFKRDNFTCQYCGRMAPDVILEVDHINPVYNGGDNDLLNLVTSCIDCNRGKGKKKLTESDEIKKQQEQLKILNERRNQLKLILEWKKELSNIENQQIEAIQDIFKETTNVTFTDKGKSNIKKYIKQYGFEDVLEAAQISVEKYYDPNNKNSIATAFDFIARICSNMRFDKEHPTAKDVNYLVKIVKNRLDPEPYKIATLRKFLLKHFEPTDMPNVKDIFKDCERWSWLVDDLLYYFNVEDFYGN